MKYPLDFRFKFLSWGPKVRVFDADGNLVLFVAMKAFKLKESIKVYTDEERTNLVNTINADRIIDFSARYSFAKADGTPLGSVKRKGAKSIWKAHYDIFRGEQIAMYITETNPFVKFLDALLGSYCGCITAFILHPKYEVRRLDETPLIRIKKKASLIEGRFGAELLADLTPEEEELAMLSVVMMMLRERARG